MFERCFCERTSFTKTEQGRRFLVVSLYVNNLTFTGNDTNSLKGILIIFMAGHDQTRFKFLGQPSPELSYADSSPIHIRRDVEYHGI